jgi:hypothetical protein
MPVVLDTAKCYNRADKSGPFYLGKFLSSEMVYPQGSGGGNQDRYVKNTFEKGTCTGNRVGEASSTVVSETPCKTAGGKRRTRKNKRRVIRKKRNQK